MTYRQLIKRVQRYSGFSDKESKIALDLFVKNLSSRLTSAERKDFASQLPIELKPLAVSGEQSRVKTSEDFIQQFSLAEGINEARAKKQVMSAWEAIKDAISAGEIQDIRAQLPNKLAQQLY